MNIKDIRKKFGSVSIVGLAKNAGKTVTLNYIIAKAYDENIKIGITTTGRDGEKTDLVTNTDKPTIYVTEGVLVATSSQALLISTVKTEILATTGIKSPMGEIVIVRIRRAGDIQIAGPGTASDIKKIVRLLQSFGAELVLVDGAIDRKAASSPTITDACIMSTGAVLGRDMKTVVERTAFAVDCYMLKQADSEIIGILSSKICIVDSVGENNAEIHDPNTCCVENDKNDNCEGVDIELAEIADKKAKSLAGNEINTYKVTDIQALTGITAGDKLREEINKNTKYVYVSGAITPLLLKKLLKNKYVKNYELIIDDGTKIFIEPNLWNEARKKGLRITVRNKINLIALSLNPVSPEGYYFDSDEFTEGIKKYIKNVEVLDVCR